MRATTPVTILGIATVWLLFGGPPALDAQPASRSPDERELLSRADAQRLLTKVAAIEQRAALADPPDSRGRGGQLPQASHTTLVSEREVNAYLAFEAGSQIPVGLTQPRITILGDHRLSATAVVDLDAVRAQHKPTGWLDPMRYLSGRLPVTASGRLTTGDGLARFELESATISSVPVPKALLQELVSYYSRTPENPRGLNLDDQFLLPARIRQIDVRRGEAVVIQ